MDPPARRRRFLVSSILLLLACAPSGARHPPLQAGLAAAVAALPWRADPTDSGPFCTDAAPCDTLLVEPRVVRLPYPAPAFFVPASRPLVLNLSTPPAADLRATGLPVRYVDWGECLARRHAPEWPTAGHACVALAVAGEDAPSDTVHLAFLVLSPARGLAWTRLRLAPARGRWEVAVLSIGSE